MTIGHSPPIATLPSRDALPRHELVRLFLRDLRETERRCLLLALDAGLITFAVTASLALAGAPSAWPVLAAWLLTSVSALYATEQYTLRLHHDRALELSAASGFVAALATAIALQLPVSAAIALLIAFGAIGLALPAGRRLLEAGLMHPTARQRVLLFGTPLEAGEVYAELQAHPLAGKHAIGLVVSRGYLPLPYPLLVLGNQAQLAPVAAQWAADSLVSGLEALQTPTWHRKLPTALPVTDVPTLCARLSGRVPVRRVDERWFVEHFRWRRGWLYKGLARFRDVVLGGAALLLATPLMAAIALALRLESQRSVIVMQPHLGRHGRVYPLFAFRTARGRHETRVGRFLRQSGLHRLPHLWSVLKGDMSLVGPVPHPVEMAAEFAGYLPHYTRRHLVKPGLTGWAQVRDPFGPPIRDLERVLGFDLFYVYQRSHRLDAVILGRSLWAVLARLTAGRHQP